MQHLGRGMHLLQTGACVQWCPSLSTSESVFSSVAPLASLSASAVVSEVRKGVRHIRTRVRSRPSPVGGRELRANADCAMIARIVHHADVLNLERRQLPASQPRHRHPPQHQSRHRPARHVRANPATTAHFSTGNIAQFRTVIDNRVIWAPNQLEQHPTAIAHRGRRPLRGSRLMFPVFAVCYSAATRKRLR